MKILIAFLVLVILHENVSGIGDGLSSSSINRFTPEAVIHHLSELARNLIKSGDEENGVPVLDPYEFEWGQLNITGGILNANVNITIGNLTGLGNFRLQEFNFIQSEISIELNVNIPSLELYLDDYKLDGSLFDAVPIKGEGVADIEVHNITLWGKVYLKPSADGKAILLDKIEDPEFSIERVVSRTQFDSNIDLIINSMVEDLLADYLTRFNKYIAASYRDTVVQYLNPTLEKFETWNLIAVILSKNN